jgi:hypothetical protein
MNDTNSGKRFRPGMTVTLSPRHGGSGKITGRSATQWGTIVIHVTTAAGVRECFPVETIARWNP